MKVLNLVKSVLAFGVVCSLMLSLNSCAKTKGCTDPLAENTNADADESDPSLCVYPREKYIGNYKGSLICNGPLKGAINNPTYDFAISERAGGTVEDVSIDLVIFGAPGKLAGKIDKVEGLKIDQLIPNITNPAFGPLPVNIKATGSAKLGADKKTLDGTINIVITIVANGVEVAKDVCPIKGTKQ
jgi:hypothetical protein